MTELLHVKDKLNVSVRELSLGERTKMELIASLLHQPKVLFLDEPTIGLDVVSQKIVREFLREHNAKHKTTILLTSHYMADVTALCPRVMLIHHGQLLYDGALGGLTGRLAPFKLIRLTLARLAQAGEPVTFIARFPQVKKFLIPSVFFSERLPLLLLGPAIFLLVPGDPQLALVVFFILLTWNAVGAGFNAVGVQELFARIIPVDKRGRVAGIAGAVGIGLAVLGAIVNRTILVEPEPFCEQKKPLQRLPLALGEYEEEVAGGPDREARRKLGEAAPVAGQDRVLLAREPLERPRKSAANRSR